MTKLIGEKAFGPGWVAGLAGVFVLMTECSLPSISNPCLMFAKVDNILFHPSACLYLVRKC
jgi:hypothetical protein